MEFRVGESSEDVLVAAEDYFLACRYIVERFGEAELSAYTSKEFSWLTLAACVFGGPSGVTLYFWHLVESRQDVKLSVRTLEGGTLVITEGSDVSRILLEEWISSRFRAL